MAKSNNIEINDEFLKELRAAMYKFQLLINQINFAKHPAEKDLCLMEISNILNGHAIKAEQEVLEYLGKYITYNYLTENMWTNPPPEPKLDE